jgi:hypothetical protein
MGGDHLGVLPVPLRLCPKSMMMLGTLFDEVVMTTGGPAGVVVAFGCHSGIIFVILLLHGRIVALLVIIIFVVAVVVPLVSEF